jgi:ERI1 exoribonuclease 2
VVDFEATCWPKGMQAKWRTHEIIEFPAILLNLETGEVEAEFHRYVKPEENPILSDFCVELTGITQSTVDQSNNNLATCLTLFNDWLREQLKARNLDFPKMSGKNLKGNGKFQEKLI